MQDPTEDDDNGQLFLFGGFGCPGGEGGNDDGWCAVELHTTRDNKGKKAQQSINRGSWGE